MRSKKTKWAIVWEPACECEESAVIGKNKYGYALVMCRECKKPYEAQLMRVEKG